MINTITTLLYILTESGKLFIINKEVSYILTSKG